MLLDDLRKRVNDYQRELGQPEATRDSVESIEMDARRALCEIDGGSFTKEVTLTLTTGVAYIYRLTPATNTDVLWAEFGRVKHSDETEVSVLSYPNSTSRDLTYPRFAGYYWGCIEANGNDVTLTVWQGDGATAAPDGTLAADFQFVQTLASWPQIHEPALVAKCADLLSQAQVAVAA